MVGKHLRRGGQSAAQTIRHADLLGAQCHIIQRLPDNGFTAEDIQWYGQFHDYESAFFAAEHQVSGRYIRRLVEPVQPWY